MVHFTWYRLAYGFDSDNVSPEPLTLSGTPYQMVPTGPEKKKKVILVGGRDLRVESDKPRVVTVEDYSGPRVVAGERWVNPKSTTERILLLHGHQAGTATITARDGRKTVAELDVSVKDERTIWVSFVKLGDQPAALRPIVNKYVPAPGAPSVRTARRPLSNGRQYVNFINREIFGPQANVTLKIATWWAPPEPVDLDSWVSINDYSKTWKRYGYQGQDPHLSPYLDQSADFTVFFAPDLPFSMRYFPRNPIFPANNPVGKGKGGMGFLLEDRVNGTIGMAFMIGLLNQPGNRPLPLDPITSPGAQHWLMHMSDLCREYRWYLPAAHIERLNP
jgi:hypothetical protein